MKIGIIGGGQLGKLFIDNLIRTNRNINVVVYSPYKPLSQHCEWFQGNLNNPNEILGFATYHKPDIITIEIENVSVSGLKEAQSRLGIKVYPDPSTIEMIQNKEHQKQFIELSGLPTAKLLFGYHNITDDLSIETRAINKLKVGGYDGYGVKVVENVSELFDEPAFVEEKIDIAKELSVIVGRNKSHQICVLPTTEMVFNNDNKLDYLLSPARISNDIEQECQRLARELAERLDLIGILAVEFFLDKNNKLWVNEMAPRPHNSGHHSVIGCTINQHELLIRCLLNENIPAYSDLILKPKVSKIIMINILGTENLKNPTVSIDNVTELEWYGKSESRPGRKLGHISTYVHDKLDLDSYVRYLKNQINIFEATCDVAVIMGSSSDLDVVKPAIKILNDFGVSYQIKVVSAHRTPHGMLKFASSAREEGYKVIIAAAGGAAHLPGMVASATTLPVIGIPVKSSNSIDGWDSLLSIAQMPGGIPVATMALNGSMNAALYAVRILSLGNSRLESKLEEYQEFLEDKVRKQNEDLVI